MDIARIARVAAATLVALGCFGCATPSSDTAAAASQPRADRVFRTGSNIPVKDPDSTMSKTIDGQSVQDDMMRGTRSGSMPGK